MNSVRIWHKKDIDHMHIYMPCFYLQGSYGIRKTLSDIYENNSHLKGCLFMGWYHLKVALNYSLGDPFLGRQSVVSYKLCLWLKYHYSDSSMSRMFCLPKEWSVISLSCTFSVGSIWKMVSKVLLPTFLECKTRNGIQCKCVEKIHVHVKSGPF